MISKFDMQTCSAGPGGKQAVTSFSEAHGAAATSDRGQEKEGIMVKLLSNTVAATTIVTLLLALFGYFFGGTVPAASF